MKDGWRAALKIPWMVLCWAEQSEQNSVENWVDSKVASWVDRKVSYLADLSDWLVCWMVDLLAVWVGWMVGSWADLTESMLVALMA